MGSEQATCPACKAEVPADAEVCQHCTEVLPWSRRAKQQRSQRLAMIVLVGIVAVMGVWWFVSDQLSDADRNARDDICDIEAPVRPDYC